MNEENPQCDNIVNDERLINCKNDNACVIGVFKNASMYYENGI